MEKLEFNEALKDKVAYINAMLERYLPAEEGFQKIICEAMNYSVRVGGKRLRPMMMWESFLLCGGKEADRELVEPFMAALEMIHTYSLIHDDLPAMDNDLLRRGNPTTWAKYGEANGVLAGDGLLNFAFETALKAFAQAKDMDTMQRVVHAMEVLSKKAGIYGMIGGQTVDLEAEGAGDCVSEEMLTFIHAHKTAALIQASLCVGAILSGADETEISKLEKAAYNIGLAFQIQDDILDVIGSTEELGKPVGSDDDNSKMTYVRLKGIEASKAEVASLSMQAIELIDSFETEHAFLSELVNTLIDRRK